MLNKFDNLIFLEKYRQDFFYRMAFRPLHSPAHPFLGRSVLFRLGLRESP